MNKKERGGFFMYIPIVKTRNKEFLAVKKMSDKFGKDFIPYFEIIKDRYEKKYLLNEVGEIVTEVKKTRTGKKKNYKVELEPTEEDICTLGHINNIVNEEKAFIDFFRFSIPTKEYKKFALDKVMLSFQMSRDFNYYKKRIFEISTYPNFIPVLSIKKGLEIGKVDFVNLLTLMKSKFTSIAIRITSECLDEYKEEIIKNLREDDYFIFDIRNNSMTSKIMELQEIKEYKLSCNMILFNSPRSTELVNGDYEESSIEFKIDNSVCTKYKNYEFDGFGDFGGLKDELPAGEGSGGMGTALSLLYNYKDNHFYSFKNDNSKDGMKGYKKVVEDIFANIHLLGDIKGCPGINKIEEIKNRCDGKYGNWSTWNEITLLRYMSQQCLKIKHDN
ncbi:hypothetical protein FL870_10495 [Listeria monocytogenes]|nr:hypothetical protein [Listeria monocytogenes]